MDKSLSSFSTSHIGQGLWKQFCYRATTMRWEAVGWSCDVTFSISSNQFTMITLVKSFHLQKICTLPVNISYLKIRKSLPQPLCTAGRILCKTMWQFGCKKLQTIQILLPCDNGLGSGTSKRFHSCLQTVCTRVLFKFLYRRRPKCTAEGMSLSL